MIHYTAYKMKGQQKAAPFLMLLISIIVTFVFLAGTASAVVPGEIVNLTTGAGASTGSYQGGFLGYNRKQFGARVTLVDAQTGRRAAANASIDYVNKYLYDNGGMSVNGNRVPFNEAYVVGGLCKSDYVIDGATPVFRKGTYNPSIAPTAKDEQLRDKIFRDRLDGAVSIMPRTVTMGTENAATSVIELKEYFGNQWVIKSFLQSIGMITTKDDTDPGWIEFHSGKYKLLIEPLTFTFVEQGSQKAGFIATPTEYAIVNITNNSYFGDLAGTPTDLRRNFPSSMLLEQAEFGRYNANPGFDDTSRIGDCYTVNTIKNHCGLMTITVDPQGPLVYYHLYTDTRTPNPNVNIAALNGMSLADQLANSTQKSATWTCLNPTGTQPVYQSDNKYYPSKDETLAGLLTSNQIITLGAYKNPPVIGEESITKATTNKDNYPTADILRQYPAGGVDITNPQQIPANAGLDKTVGTVTPVELHVAIYKIAWDLPGTEIYYHTLTLTADPPENPPPVKEYYRDHKDEFDGGWTQTAGSIPGMQPTYEGTTDPNRPQGDLVGVLGYPKIQKVEDDGEEEYPQEGKDGNPPQQWIPQEELDFDSPLNPLTRAQIMIYPPNKDQIVEIHVAIVNLAYNPPSGMVNDDTPDRIKSYDVTQWINGTKQVTDDSEHLSSLLDIVKPAGEYNNSQLQPHSTHAQNVDTLAVMVSNTLSFEDNNKVRAKNYIGQTGQIICNTSASAPDYYCSGHWDSSINDRVDRDDDCAGGCSHSCYIYQYKCKMLLEQVQVYYGLNPSQKQRYKDVSGKATQISGYKTGDELKNSNKFTDVGFTVPTSYYTHQDVVKFAGSGKISGDEEWYFLPDSTGKPDKANKYATFDVLYNINGSYRLKYFDDVNEVGTTGHIQSKTQDNTDRQQDYKSSNAHLQFDFTNNADGAKIDGIQFIAHRDLTSGDKVTASLAVSSYMAKYATKSNTYAYLEFMRDSGFAFNSDGATGELKTQDDINGKNIKIDHQNRTVWIARAATTSELKGTHDGYDVDAYNTDYVGGKDEKNLKTETHVRIGLGGKSGDATNMYNLIDKNELRNSSLNKDTDKGDALRSIWYTTQISESDEGFNCDKSYSASHHTTWTCTGNSAQSHATHTNSAAYSPLHSVVKDPIHNATSISDNKYILKDGDTYLNNGYYDSKAVFDKTQSDVLTDIYLSRVEFRIPLAVEGTTAGEYTTDSTKGLKYKPTKGNGNIMNDAKLYVDDENYLKLEYTKQELEDSWRTNTFEIIHNNYQNVGTAKGLNNSHVLAEYRFTTPTEEYEFNPSYYMQFDDDFDDVNKSVWMLSEQPRKTNFKDILDVRLTYGNDATNNSDIADVTHVYNTEITSAWSTDLADTKVHDVTNLPTAKAGNSYQTTTDAISGTITAYVVLQDPEFAKDPDSIEQSNKAKLETYKNQMQSILDQFNNVATRIPKDSAVIIDKNSLSLAMYTNMVNGSSKNSGFRVTDTQGGVGMLDDKEPMIFSSDTKIDFSVTTGDKGNTTVSDGSWSYYALKGYEVTPLHDTGAISGYAHGCEGDDVDISDTTEADRKILNQDIQPMKNAPAYQQEVLNTLNDNLCGLMVEPWNKKGTHNLRPPEETQPYKDEGGNLNWYSEDYEGFIVAVYEISYTISGEGNLAADSHSSGSTDSFGTEFRAIYRGESDWKANTNTMAALDEHKLEVYNKDTWNGFNIDTFTNVSSKYEFTGNNAKKSAWLESDGSFNLLTQYGETILKNWSEENSDFDPGIYGVGVELANLKISFGAQATLDDETMPVIGGSNGSPISFYYQPTFFNIRGSVYDTAG